MQKWMEWKWNANLQKNNQQSAKIKQSADLSTQLRTEVGNPLERLYYTGYGKLSMRSLKQSCVQMFFGPLYFMKPWTWVISSECCGVRIFSEVKVFCFHFSFSSLVLSSVFLFLFLYRFNFLWYFSKVLLIDLTKQ